MTARWLAREPPARIAEPHLRDAWLDAELELVMYAQRPPALDSTAFVPAGRQDEILMLLRLDRALLELFAVHGRNITAYRTAKAKYGLS